MFNIQRKVQKEKPRAHTSYMPEVGTLVTRRVSVASLRAKNKPNPAFPFVATFSVASNATIAHIISAGITPSHCAPARRPPRLILLCFLCSFAREIAPSYKRSHACSPHCVHRSSQRLAPQPRRLHTADQLTGAETSPLPLVHRVHSLPTFRALHFMPEWLTPWSPCVQLTHTYHKPGSWSTDSFI